MGSIKNLEPGRYKAFIKDYGITEVESLGALKAFIQMDIEHEGAFYNGTFDCFCLKKDGTPNQKLIKTLITCGFSGENVGDLVNQGALDMQKEYEVTVILDGEYKRIEWINDPAFSMISKVNDPKVLGGLNFRSEFKNARDEMGIKPKPKVKNYAPGASNDPDEMGF